MLHAAGNALRRVCTHVANATGEAQEKKNNHHQMLNWSSQHYPSKDWIRQYEHLASFRISSVSFRRVQDTNARNKQPRVDQKLSQASISASCWKQI